MSEIMTIRGHPKYSVSNDGFIINGKGHIMKPTHDKDGYNTIRICENGSYIRLILHRVIAEHFISNPNNLPQVNHKDGNKDNCHDWNLEWCTGKHNTQHSYNTGLHKVGKVIQMKDGIEIARFNNAKEASDITGISALCIRMSISRKTKSGGYNWKRKSISENMEV